MGRFNVEAFNIPLEKVAEALGMRKGGAKGMWYSPFREEKEASLHIDSTKNLWYDHGAGVGGTNVQLVMMVSHCGKREAYEFLEKIDPSISRQTETTPKPAASKSTIKQVRDIRSYYLTSYLAKRKIPLELAKQYLKEVIVYNPGKDMHFTLVGFPNNSGAFALTSPSGFKSTNKADISTFNIEGQLSEKPSAKSVAIFEGYFDFLSWQVMQSSKKPSCDVVVLNSVNNIHKAEEYIAAHDKALCFLDNDPAGQECCRKVEDLMQGREVIDMSDLYGEYKDINEMLQASRGYTADMSIGMEL